MAMTTTIKDSTLHFDLNFQPGKYRLMELDEHILTELGLNDESNEFDDLLPTK
jgi:hypothetical protein